MGFAALSPSYELRAGKRIAKSAEYRR
jgi:hypothetical protein